MKNLTKKIILGIIALVFALAGLKAEAQTGVTSAVLNASVNPGGVQTTAWFEYGTNPSLNTWTETNRELVGSHNYARNFSQTVYNLQPNTTYYFRVATNNGYNTYRAQILSFTTGGTNTVYNTNQTYYENPSTVNVTRYVVNETKYVDRVVQPQVIYTQPQPVYYQTSYQPVYQPVAYQPVSYQPVVYQQPTSNVVYQPTQPIAYQPTTNYIPATTYKAPVTTTTNSTLVATPVLGANFLPNSILGWLVLIALIFAVVLVARRLAR